MMEVAGTLGSQLGAALRAERFLRSTSQRALARELGVSKSFIGRLESGDLRGSAAVVADLVERLGLAFAIVVPDDALGAAMVDDSDEARRLAEEWRTARQPDDQDDTHEAAASPFDDAGGTPPPGSDRPSTTRGPAAGGDGPALDGPTLDGPVLDGPALDEPAPDESLDDKDAPPPPPGRRPSWLASSRTTTAEDLTVPGRPPPTGQGRRVVVGTPAAWRSMRMDRFYSDAGVRTVAESWLHRAEAERVRDAAGRRMPAHVVCYPVQLPRSWWYCRHVAWSWTRRPIWSWRRQPLWEDEARRTGPNPPPLGAHPDGGWPMQGRPSDDTRGDWPPDPRRRFVWFRPAAGTR